MREIARQANVSVTLVSRLFNKDTTLQITDAKREHIYSVRDRLGGLKVIRGRTHQRQAKKEVYNIVVPANTAVKDIVFSRLSTHTRLQSMENFLSTKHAKLSLNTFFQEGDAYELIKRLVDSSGFCDGVLLLSKVVNDDIANLLIKRRFPHVSLALDDTQYGVNTIGNNILSSLQEVLVYLRNLGHERIGYVGLCNFRYSMFLAALGSVSSIRQSEDISVILPERLHGKAVREFAYRHFVELLNSGKVQATAFICTNDHFAFGVIDAMKELGLCPGRDISIVGVDNIEGREGAVYPEGPVLTSLHNPFEAIGRRAGELLINQIKHKQLDIVHEYLPMKLVVRGSTGRCCA